MNNPSGPIRKSLPDPYVRIIAVIHMSLMVAAFWLLSMLEGRQDDRSAQLRAILIVLMLIGAILIYFLGTTYSLSGWSRQDYRFHMLLREIFAYMTIIACTFALARAAYVWVSPKKADRRVAACAAEEVEIVRELTTTIWCA